MNEVSNELKLKMRSRFSSLFVLSCVFHCFSYVGFLSVCLFVCCIVHRIPILSCDLMPRWRIKWVPISCAIWHTSQDSWPRRSATILSGMAKCVESVQHYSFLKKS
jgi:hypothetical protein